MDVRIQATGRHDLTLAGDDVRAASHDHALGNAVHDVRVAGLANADDQPVFNADICLVDAGPVHDQRVHHHHIQAISIRAPGHLTHTLAQRLASAELALVSIRRQVFLHLHPQVRRAQTHQVAHRRAEHSLVRGAVQRIRIDASQVAGGLGRVREPGLLEGGHDGLGAREVDLAGGEPVAAPDDAVAADLDHGHGLGVAGLEAHAGAGRDVEPVAVRGGPVELELRVRLDEVVVAADLDRPVPLARDLEPDAPAPLVQRDAALDDDHGARLPGGLVGGRLGGREQVLAGDRQEAAVEGLGQVAVVGGDRVVHRHEVRARGEGALDLDLVQRADDGREHVPPAQHRGPDGHEIRNAVLAIADEFLEVVRDESLCPSLVIVPRWWVGLRRSLQRER